MEAKSKYQPIENYGVIGDLRTIALVGKNGSIDFMCFPNFDSPTIFAALLDSEKGGFFQITPLNEKIKRKQMYLPDTNILLTRFLFEEGIGEITDFMPISTFCEKNTLIRSVMNIKGKISYRMRCCPRFNYAKNSHQVKLNRNSIIFTSEGKDGICLKLNSSVPLQLKDGDAYSEFTLNPGEKAEFILENVQDNKKICTDSKNFVEKNFTQTLSYWKEWTAKSTYNGRWREMVIRSALVLKLLISSQYGSIAAAPTFALPEKIGGSKNWDYRFGWIRDTAFTIRSLMLIGYKDEAQEFMRWIEKICASLHSKSVLKPLYSLNGKKALNELELNYFEGYMNSSPVRIGNRASKQLQLDVYGEFIDSIYLCDKHISLISEATWLHLSGQINWLLKNWRNKDSSIWETRGKPEEYLFSRLMCWVAIDRAIRIGNRRSFPSPASWIKTRNEIYKSIYNDFWNEKRQAFIQFKKNNEVDASTLLMPLMKFISPKDPKWISTLKNIEHDLIVDCLVYRYKPEEDALFGLNKGEGTFSACSFWYIECLTRLGEMQKAQVFFDKMLSYANPLGLYSEQLGTKGELLGNFPQAFTHLSLISAAYDLNKHLDKKMANLYE
jgi:GH15 family glucan-1,4-alpha-glucosidase